MPAENVSRAVAAGRTARAPKAWPPDLLPRAKISIRGMSK
jgi:hypothetical protein